MSKAENTNIQDGTKGLNEGTPYTPWSTPDSGIMEIVLPERIGSPGKEGPAVAAVTFPAAGGIQSDTLSSQKPKPFGLHQIMYGKMEPTENALPDASGKPKVYPTKSENPKATP